MVHETYDLPTRHGWEGYSASENPGVIGRDFGVVAGAGTEFTAHAVAQEFDHLSGGDKAGVAAFLAHDVHTVSRVVEV